MASVIVNGEQAVLDVHLCEASGEGGEFHLDSTQWGFVSRSRKDLIEKGIQSVHGAVKFPLFGV